MRQQAVAICAALAFTSAHASWMAQCSETTPQKAAEAKLWLTTNIERAVPNIPPETLEYFQRENGPALNSGTPGRYLALARQPLYKAWRVRVAFNTLLTTLGTLEADVNKDAVYPYPGLAQTRIYWAAGALSQLAGLQSAIDEYSAEQQASAQPFTSADMRAQLVSVLPGIAMKMDQVVDCELDHVNAASGPALKTYSH